MKAQEAWASVSTEHHYPRVNTIINVFQKNFTKYLQICTNK